ncbi:hypothetical protein [Lyngbya sp. CCY1209]|jgi:hypothetical protein|nr:hypothetical protein [Lyngbya sp. CCY1209]MEB3885443.1 hypothetical protein [Lyngbya sp. CCY1209]
MKNRLTFYILTAQISPAAELRIKKGGRWGRSKMMRESLETLDLKQLRGF